VWLPGSAAKRSSSIAQSIQVGSTTTCLHYSCSMHRESLKH